LPEPDLAAACDSCIESQGCTVARACATSADCDAALRCIQACATEDCAYTCAAGHGADVAPFETDASVGAFADYRRLMEGSCANSCGTGAHWYCVGHVSWPVPKVAVSTFRDAVKDYVSGMPMAGVLVKACRLNDISCTQPVATGTTDEAGLVSLAIPNGMEGSAGLGWNGYAEFTAPTIMTQDGYFGSPSSDADDSAYDYVVTPSEAQLLEEAAGVTQDPLRGIVVAVVRDCLRDIAAGVDVAVSTADSLTVEYNSSFVRTTTTNADGIVIAFNVPRGTAEVTATPRAIGQVSSRVPLEVRDGRITQLLMIPTP
jgi:hypothetical protein